MEHKQNSNTFKMPSTVSTAKPKSTTPKFKLDLTKKPKKQSLKRLEKTAQLNEAKKLAKANKNAVSDKVRAYSQGAPLIHMPLCLRCSITRCVPLTISVAECAEASIEAPLRPEALESRHRSCAKFAQRILRAAIAQILCPIWTRDAPTIGALIAHWPKQALCIRRVSVSGSGKDCRRHHEQLHDVPPNTENSFYFAGQTRPRLLQAAGEESENRRCQQIHNSVHGTRQCDETTNEQAALRGVDCQQYGTRETQVSHACPTILRYGCRFLIKIVYATLLG